MTKTHKHLPPELSVEAFMQEFEVEPCSTDAMGLLVTAIAERRGQERISDAATRFSWDEWNDCHIPLEWLLSRPIDSKEVQYALALFEFQESKKKAKERKERKEAKARSIYAGGDQWLGK
jgi:hypothetical protein